MSKDRIQDCTACAHLRTHPEPMQPFHDWKCAAYGWSVGGSVMNCGSFRRRVSGECPPKADVSAFVWRAAGGERSRASAHLAQGEARSTGRNPNPALHQKEKQG